MAISLQATKLDSEIWVVNAQDQSTTNSMHLHVISFTAAPFVAWRTTHVLLRFQCIAVV